jgi:flagellar motor protein MotB
MRSIGVFGTTTMFLLLGLSVPASAWQDPHDKPQKQEQPGKPEKQQQAQADKQQQQHAQQQAKGQQDQQQKQQHQQQAQADKQQQQHAQQQAKGQQDQQRQQQNQYTQQQQYRPQQVKMQSPREQHQQQIEQRNVWQERRATNWQSEHRDWQQRGGYNGYRIPQNHYTSYFGPTHAFRMYSYPVVVVGGCPRFQYGGYYFNVVDPWPQYWSNDWYANDDVYVDYYGGGYYLHNRRYPRDRIAISVNVGGGENGRWGVAWQQHRAHNWQNEHRDWQQRGGYYGYQIPEDSYRGYFGPDHGFRMSSYPVTVVGGYPRFQYGGYFFSVVDPWPEYWSDNWYDSDDMYIDNTGDGYYLYNRRYPQDRIALNVDAS